MTGKLSGPFDVDYLSLKDFQGNELLLPKMTAVTLFISGLAILKTTVDMNLVRIHLQEGHKFVQLAKYSIVFLPFFMVSTFFRLSSISILLTYASVWILFPAITMSFLVNLVYGIKRCLLTI